MSLATEKVPTAIVKLEAGGIKVELQNWTGCSMAMAERMWFEVLKAVQAHRAQSLQQMRNADAAKETANA